jgi:hypothetical protein
MKSEIISGIILIVIGLIFFFNNKAIGEGAFKFYRKLYTKKSLPIMFKIAGIILIVGGVILMVVK